MTNLELAERLKLHRAGREWRGNCPLCGYRDSFSLTKSNGRLLGWCASCQDRDAVRMLLRDPGRISQRETLPQDQNQQNQAERRRNAQERAMRLWQSGEPVAGTIAETYLVARKVPHLTASAALRFRGDSTHPTGGRFPAILALVLDASENPLGLHRTYLARNGSGKATVEPARASLGPIWGGAIRLHPGAPEIVIGEGIETSGSAGLLMGLPAWAAISAGNLSKGLNLPPMVRAVIVAADPDQPGEKAAREAANRWLLEGRRVRIARPTDDGDFNDLLRTRAEIHYGE